jgi:hypothetical protein
MRFRFSATWQFVQIVCCLILLFSGCGHPKQVLNNTAHLSGSITFNGNPLPAGTIVLHSTEHSMATPVPIRAGGTFSTDRAPIGKNLVTVDTRSIKFGNPSSYVPIPDKYIEPETSTLTVDVSPGDNSNVEFALKN